MSWESFEIELVAVTRLMQTIAAMKGIAEGTAVAAETLGQALEVISPIALLQKASSLLVDKSALISAILAVITSMNKDVAELYPYVPIHETDRNRPPDSLLQLLLDSLSFRHLSTVGAYVPGANSPETALTVQEMPEVKQLDQLDFGLGSLNRFSGFVVLTTTTADNYGSITEFFKSFLTVPALGLARVLRTTPRVYSFSKLITPITVPSGRIFDPIWRAIKTVQKTTGVLEGAQNLQKKLRKLGRMLQERAKTLRALVAEIEKLEALLSVIPNDVVFSVLTFSDLDIKELQSVFFGDGRPTGTEAAGFMVVAADPGISQLLELIRSV